MVIIIGGAEEESRNHLRLLAVLRIIEEQEVAVLRLLNNVHETDVETIIHRLFI